VLPRARTYILAVFGTSGGGSIRQTNESQPATFVFKGTVKKLNSATMKDVPLSDRIAIVTVDQIIEAPPDLAGYAAQKITVELSGHEKVGIGQQLVFHATGWMFGDGVAVRSLKEEPVEKRDEASAGTTEDAVELHAENLKRSHFEDADLVVSGKVVAVRLPVETDPGRKRTSAVAPGPITEHDPNWREAIIQVDEVLKGTHQEKQIVVRFPASSDVRWHGTPKVEAGQHGYFMLHQAKAAKPASKGARIDARDTVTSGYQVLDLSDFQPFDEPGGIRTLLASESTKRKK
jgi:hypothetical protein